MHAPMAFDAEVWYWRGPSPYHFVWVPEGICVGLRAIASAVTYGWGMIPVRGRIGATEFETSLFPKDGRYVVPIKDVVRRAENLSDGDTIKVELAVRHDPMKAAHNQRDEETYDLDTPPHGLR